MEVSRMTIRSERKNEKTTICTGVLYVHLCYGRTGKSEIESVGV